MPKDEQRDALVSTAELATSWGCHVRTIHRMVNQGLLTPYLRGPGSKGAYLFRADDVAEKPAAKAAA